MNCDVCKQKTATVFLTQIVDGKMQKVNLCESCSKEKGVTDPKGFALADLLLGLGASEEMERSGTGQKCPMCGFSQADFKKTGRFGCSNCYEVFADGLEAMLKGMHKGTTHTGKVPQRLLKARQHAEELKRLQRELRKAVDDEKYEAAAELRDKIKHLEPGAAGKV
jgi:protein arginine kinase activator